MDATDPGGATYTLRRRWWPWRWKQRFSARPWDSKDLSAFDTADGVLGFFLGVAGLVVIAVVLPVVFLLLMTGIEWLVLLTVLPIAVLGRLVFGKHWTIEVRHENHLWEIDGGSWRESAALIQQIAAQIASGDVPAGFDQTPIEA